MRLAVCIPCTWRYLFADKTPLCYVLPVACLLICSPKIGTEFPLTGYQGVLFNLHAAFETPPLGGSGTCTPHSMRSRTILSTNCPSIAISLSSEQTLQTPRGIYVYNPVHWNFKIPRQEVLAPLVYSGKITTDFPLGNQRAVLWIFSRTVMLRDPSLLTSIIFISIHYRWAR